MNEKDSGMRTWEGLAARRAAGLKLGRRRDRERAD